MGWLSGVSVFFIEPGDWECATGECLPAGSEGVLVHKTNDRLKYLTDHDWLQIEQAARGCVSGTSDEWPDLVRAIEKIKDRKLMRQSAAWLRGYCEALVESR